VKRFFHPFLVALFRAGGMGVFGLAILDSTFLILPLGIDLLLIALSAHSHTRMPYYAAMAALGSVAGCWTTDWLSRKGHGKLKEHVSRKHLKFFQDKMEKHAAWILAFASLMPPPFPFTPFVAGAAALKYPREKLLSVIGAARLLRFSIEGGLAIYYGTWLIRFAKSDTMEYTMIGVIVISALASIYSIYRWVESSQKSGRRVLKRA